MSSGPHMTVLCVDDDPGDLKLLEDAFFESGAKVEVSTISRCEDLPAYLAGKEPFEGAPTPDIILLDLNMQPKDGREALTEIKADKHFCRIPVVVFSGSLDPRDIALAYEQGANSYLRKPDGFAKLVELARVFVEYWFNVCELPSRRVY